MFILAILANIPPTFQRSIATLHQRRQRCPPSASSAPPSVPPVWPAFPLRAWPPCARSTSRALRSALVRVSRGTFAGTGCVGSRAQVESREARGGVVLGALFHPGGARCQGQRLRLCSPLLLLPPTPILVLEDSRLAARCARRSPLASLTLADSELASALAAEHAYETEGASTSKPQFLQDLEAEGVWSVQDTVNADDVVISRKFGDET